MSSTATFFSDFFPTAHGLLSTQWPALWRTLQPAWLADSCPEQQAAVPLPPALGGSGLTAAPTPLLLRNPHLLPFQLAGLLVALFGLRSLQGAGHTYLRHSLLFFGGMNARWVLANARWVLTGSQLID